MEEQVDTIVIIQAAIARLLLLNVEVWLCLRRYIIDCHHKVVFTLQFSNLDIHIVAFLRSWDRYPLYERFFDHRRVFLILQLVETLSI